MKLTAKILWSAVLCVLVPLPAFACATCYGATDSPMAEGMNWGIFTLMGVIGTVLATFLTFFIFITRKSAALADAAEKSTLSPQV